MPFYTNYPVYPTEVLDTTDYPDQEDNKNDVLAVLVNALRDEMIAVQAELGTNPRGASADVKTLINTKATSPVYVDRGDPAAFDWTIATLTADNAWHDLDLSGIIPAGVIGVTMGIRINGPTINKQAILRTKGNTNNVNFGSARTQVANQLIQFDFILAVNSERKLQYYISSLAWTVVDFWVRGWWK